MKYIVSMIVIISGVSLAMGPGNSAGTFLKLSVDARNCGMGEVGAAYFNNASSIYYNPAGLGQMGKYDIVFMHNQWLLGMYHEFLAIGFTQEKIGGFGLLFNYWDSGKIEGFDERGDTIRINGAPYTFSAYDWAFGLGYGKSFDQFSLGLAMKFISEKNESLSTSGAGFDFGAKFFPPVKGLTMGTSVANVGSKLRLHDAGLAFSLPLMWRIGMAYKLNRLGLGWDLIICSSDDISTGLGIEYWLVEVLALRFGYKSGSNVDGISGLRTGLGIKYKGFGIDYAFAPYGSLGLTHKISVSWGIEPVTKPLRIKKPTKPSIRKK